MIMMNSKNNINGHPNGKGFLTPTLRNESGAVLVMAVLFLVVILSMVPVSMQMTSGDISRSQDFKETREAFFVAEAGLEHAKYLTELSSAGAALAGPDADPATTPDNGTFGVAGGTLENGYDKVTFNNNTYFIQVLDNDDGDSDPTNDVDFLVVLSSVGIVDGATTTVEATVYYPTFPTSALSTNGNLDISGNPNIAGSCGSVHSNGNLDIGGSAVISVDATATGSYSGGSETVGGTSGGGLPEIPIPYLNPTDFQQYADYTFAADGKVYDSNNNFIHDASSTPWNGWDYSSPKWTQSESSSIDAFLYVDGDVIVGSNPGTPGSPWEVTIVATGYLEISGNPEFINYKNPLHSAGIQDLFLIAGTDIKYNGNPFNTLEGLIYAGEQIDFSGNATVNGAILAYDHPNSSEGLVSENKISGNPNITYGCGLIVPNVGGVEVVSWNEL